VFHEDSWEALVKSDSERQSEYQKRRTEKESRVTFWLPKDVEAACEKLRGDQSRNDWLNRAVIELIYRHLSGKRFGQLYSEAEHRQTLIRAREMGVKL
jgi:hypothetical protein